MALPLHATAGMTLRIESVSDEHGTTIRLIGRMQAQHVEELKAQIGASGARVVLDLEELSLVDIDAVRFLGTCQAGGISPRSLSAVHKRLDCQRAGPRHIEVQHRFTTDGLRPLLLASELTARV